MKRSTDFDFGVTGLAGLFHQDWTNFGEVEEVVLRISLSATMPLRMRRNRSTGFLDQK